MIWFWKMLGWDLYERGSVRIWAKGPRGRGGYDNEVREFMDGLSAHRWGTKLRFVLRFTD